MKNNSFIISGFGGQGILFTGKQIAIAAMNGGLNVLWLPSYGPEMKGGVANCSVIISEEEIGSPTISKPDVLIVLNQPSFDKFEPNVKPGGLLIADSSLVAGKSARQDISAHYIPASELAVKNSLEGLANVIILGAMLKITGLFTFDYFIESMCASIPASKAALIEKNKFALRVGYDYL